MEIIKKINNNFALAKDEQGRELVAYGKGIGFPKMPYELNDLSKIDRTFYDVKEENIPMFQNADEQVIELSFDLIDHIRLHINKSISDYLYYVLVDHISFAIERYKRGLYVPMKLSNEIRYNYSDEYEEAKKCLSYINKKMDVKLPKDEQAIIAMHIDESEASKQKSSREVNIDNVIEKSLRIIQEDLDIKIDREGFNAYRFITHLKYLIQRLEMDSIESNNIDLYETVKSKFPNINMATEDVCAYLSMELNKPITDEEKLYLMLHINRLSDRN